MPTFDLCPDCDGTGDDPVTGWYCPCCHGKGFVEDRDDGDEWDGFEEADEDDSERGGEDDNRASFPVQP